MFFKSITFKQIHLWKKFLWTNVQSNGTKIVNWALSTLHEGSLEITLTVPLSQV